VKGYDVDVTVSMRASIGLPLHFRVMLVWTVLPGFSRERLTSAGGVRVRNPGG